MPYWIINGSFRASRQACFQAKRRNTPHSKRFANALAYELAKPLECAASPRFRLDWFGWSFERYAGKAPLIVAPHKLLVLQPGDQAISQGAVIGYPRVVRRMMLENEMVGGFVFALQLLNRRVPGFA